MAVREKISGSNIFGAENTMSVQLGNADCICYARTLHYPSFSASIKVELWTANNWA